MAIVTGSYILMAAALTLMVPYNQIHPTSAFADAFEKVNCGRVEKRGEYFVVFY